MQSINWIEAITWMFVIANTGRLVAYLPQFLAAWNCPSGAKSVSILTWSYFTFAHFTALLYALFALRDSRSAWIFSGNLLATACLVTLLLWKRLQHSRTAQRSDFAENVTVDATRHIMRPPGRFASNDDCYNAPVVELDIHAP